MVIRQPVFSEEECLDIWDKLQTLERFWTPAHPKMPAFTLGAAAYLHIRDGGTPAYLRRMVPGNKIIKRHFMERLETVAAAIAPHIEGEVYITSRFALPGFQVFGAHPDLMHHRIVPHYDFQDIRLEWEDDMVRRPNERISFTVPIVVPSAGTGLNVWENISMQMGETWPSEETLALAKRIEPTMVHYRTGEMVIHTGDQLHDVAGINIPEGERRVTLQGHGRPTDQGFELYW